jgi:hypothetical protein
MVFNLNLLFHVTYENVGKIIGVAIIKMEKIDQGYHCIIYVLFIIHIILLSNFSSSTSFNTISLILFTIFIM